jgi:Cys-rich repeat protein
MVTIARVWLVILILASAGTAGADRMLSVRCPAGTQPVSASVGAACQVPQCRSDADCPGEVCRDTALCMRHEVTRDRFAQVTLLVEHPVGPCDEEGGCSGEASCYKAPRCVSVSRQAAPPVAATGGCTHGSGSAAMLAPLVLLGGPRRRRYGSCR